MLARRGLSCDVSSLVRISTATAAASTRLRDAALGAALRLPVPADGPLAGKRVRVSLDGGRGRTRRRHGGRYVETHAHRMRYVTLEARQLSIGSGQVERAGRRVITLRFKALGSFWTETTVSGLRHLRAAFKAGRWDEVMRGVATGTFQVPSFEPVGNAAPQRSAAVREHERPHMCVTPRKKAA